MHYSEVVEGEIMATKPKQPVIQFEAIVNNVKTLTSDNTIRITLDLPETAINIMAMLAQTKVDGIVLDVQCRAKTT